MPFFQCVTMEYFSTDSRLQFLCLVTQFSVGPSFTSLVRFVLGCFVLFDARVDGIALLIFPSGASLSV